MKVKVRLNQLSLRPDFSKLPNRPILLVNCVSGVPVSLSAAGVPGVSPPELKSMSRDGVRMDQGVLGWTCAGTEDAGVVGSLLGSRLKYVMRLSGSRRRFGVAKPFFEGESRAECEPGWPKVGPEVSCCLPSRVDAAEAKDRPGSLRFFCWLAAARNGDCESIGPV
jgi:hypothetical protein